MGLPRVYRQSPAYVASYSWLNLTAGLGYRRYYGACTLNLANARIYFLATELIDSGSGNAIGSTAAYTSSGGALDIDFDITFGVPAIVGGGDAFFNLTHETGATNSAMTINVYHVDLASAETLLGTFADDSQEINIFFRHLLKVPLTAKKFAVGEKLRVNVVATNLAPATIVFFHDPTSLLTKTDEIGRTIGTDFTCDIPFKISL